MQRLKVIVLALVAVFAISAVASATASAHEFVASKEGNLTGKALNTHKFKTSAGTVECEIAKASGTVVAPLIKETQLGKVKYEKCHVTFIGNPAAEVAPEVEYEFFAGETKEHPLVTPWVTLKNNITITIPSAGCKIEVNSAGNSELKSVSYANLAGGKLEIKATVKGITYKGTGGLCGNKEEKNGEYTGNEEVGLEAGTIEWK
jgi:hypothetical protein